MTKKKKLLQSITTNFHELVLKPRPHELNDHIPIYGNQMQIIGYWNIRCYNELRQMLQNNH